MSTDGLRVVRLTRSFPRPGQSGLAVLRDLDLDVGGGEIVAIVGASGTGKSTLLHVVGGMLRPDSGLVALGGVAPWSLRDPARADWRRSQIGFVFQTHHLLGDLTALENVMVPGWIRGRCGPEARDRAIELLDRLGLAGRLHHLPRELSGGEGQRVAVARALVLRPRLVLADEPTGNLDREAGLRVFEELVALQRDHRFIALVATHDNAVAERCDRVEQLADGNLSPWPRGRGV